MTTAVLVDRFKKHINIDGKNHVAYVDAALVNVFINRYIVNTVDHEMFYFDTQF